jgi:RNA polymerase sigma factor (sigma-70 family)
MQFMSEQKTTPASDCFPTTQWTGILNVIQTGGGEASWKALEDFCERYRPAIYNFFRRRGRNHGDAEEFTQEFFLTRIHKRWDIQKGFLFRAKRSEQSKFRCFLCTALRAFMVDMWRESQRGLPEAPNERSLTDRSDLENHPDPDQIGRLVDREVALEIIKQAASDFTHSKYLLAHFRGDLSQAAAAAKLGVSEGAFRVAYHRFRKRFLAALRKEVGKLVGPNPDEIDTEIKYLMTLFVDAGE